MDKHTLEQRRKNMQAVRATDSKIELLLRKGLYASGIRYRKNYNQIEGKPDIAIIGKKIAVFCDSEFWHGKDWKNRKKEIKSNKDFWYKKIERNIERDKEVNKELKRLGWTVLRFWGEEIIKDVQKCVYEVKKNIINYEK